MSSKSIPPVRVAAKLVEKAEDVPLRRLGSFASCPLTDRSTPRSHRFVEGLLRTPSASKPGVFGTHSRPCCSMSLFALEPGTHPSRSTEPDEAGDVSKATATGAAQGWKRITASRWIFTAAARARASSRRSGMPRAPAWMITVAARILVKNFLCCVALIDACTLIAVRVSLICARRWMMTVISASAALRASRSTPPADSRPQTPSQPLGAESRWLILTRLAKHPAAK
mmetsp:Transcript_3245/g.8065  ORF Transcript_3245/g.8065 Transcript_3245/m.8065 type:complete len:227 (-) Transcript_3245:605-1285(-)